MSDPSSSRVCTNDFEKWHGNVSWGLKKYLFSGGCRAAAAEHNDYVFLRVTITLTYLYHGHPHRPYGRSAGVRTDG